MCVCVCVCVCACVYLKRNSFVLGYTFRSRGQPAQRYRTLILTRPNNQQSIVSSTE